MYTIQNASTLYISQAKGDDKRYNGLAPAPDCNGNGPFKSLKHTLQILRELRTAQEKRPFTVAFTDDYFLEGPVLIDDPIQDVTFESFGGRKKIIGGISIGGWGRDQFNGVECLSAKLPPRQDGKKWSFTDLFINGNRASVTRYPKEGSLRVRYTDSVPTDPAHLELFEKPATQFAVYPEDLEGVDKIEDAIINYDHYWIDEHSPITSYDAKSGLLTMQYHSRFSASGLYERNHPSAVFYYLTHVPNTFGAKNEWYLDREEGKVYYIPAEETLDPADVVAYAPTLDHFAEITGQDIRIRNLEFTCTAGDYASTYTPDPETGAFVEGNVGYGSDIQSVCWAPGAIRMKNAKRCTVSNCYIHGVGIHAIEVKTGCRDIRIENNCIDDICAGGIKVFGGAYEEDETHVTRNCVIKGNRISNCGKRYEAGCGVFVAHASCNEIADNEIFNIGYSGISVGWVWGYAPSSTFGNLIRGNHIYNIGRGRISDLGGIYLLGKQHGTQVLENRIHRVRRKNYGGWGIYLDEGSSYITVEGNVVWDTEDESFHLHYGSHNTLRNNIFYSEHASCIRISKKEDHDQLACEQNVFLTNGSPIYHSSKTSGVRIVKSRRNLLWDFAKTEPVLCTDLEEKTYSLAQYQEAFHQETESVAADPCMEGIERQDFTLSQNSPAYSLGVVMPPKKTVKG